MNGADLIDQSIFGQFLELDEDPSDRSFSRDLVSRYFEQASDTFQKMKFAM
jgi:osomolarity two-component system phosphorelay intermediate protein YPD1